MAAESSSIRERISELLQKSRKAVRLYSSMTRHNADRTSQFADLQIQQWHHVNHELVRELGKILEEGSLKRLAHSLFELRDIFFSQWKDAEEQLHRRHKELHHATENGDYIKCAVVAQDLVVAKSRMQASQAAHHELSQVIERSKLSSPPIELATVLSSASGATAGAHTPKHFANMAVSHQLLSDRDSMKIASSGKVLPFQARRASL